jgi:hypothetical protein
MERLSNVLQCGVPPGIARAAEPTRAGDGKGQLQHLAVEIDAPWPKYQWGRTRTSRPSWNLHRFTATIVTEANWLFGAAPEKVD